MEWWLNHVGQMAQLVQDYSLIIHALKPPCCLVCDDLRKIFCKINPRKTRKEKINDESKKNQSIHAEIMDLFYTV